MFAERNEELQNGKWIDGWRAFCESKRASYTSVLKGLETEETTPRQKERKRQETCAIAENKAEE